MIIRKRYPQYANCYQYNNAYSSNRNYSKSNSPAVNILENNDEFKIEMAVPGFSKKDIAIDIQ